MKDHFFLAFNNLRRRGIRSWLTLIGIFIGIAAVVSLITLGNGLKVAAMSQFGVESTEIITIQAGGLNAYGPPGSFAVNKLTKEFNGKDIGFIAQGSKIEIEGLSQGETAQLVSNIFNSSNV